ncbi:hypothetical protein [Paraglaciecola sp.]|uniref:hypothetical protein n=1 Tax=Paraglaciecola sp. TaxID=1920173 RepID=UPI0030F3BF4E
MKILNKMSVVLLSSGLFTLAAVAASISKPAMSEGDYRMRILHNCELVAEYNMSPAQIEAYQHLQKTEDSMHGLELPIKAIEQQMKEYSDKLESLTALAIQETDTSLHIDKNALKQQEVVAKQLSDLVKLHQADFDAIGQQGQKISAVVDKFEQAMAVTLDGIEHDQIEIVSPTEAKDSHNCYKRI